MKQLFLHPSVVEEISEAKYFYNSKVDGLGNQLLDEIRTAIKFIEESPQAWPAYNKNLHRFILRRFPFSIVYRIKEKEIQIIAFMHHRRKPFYWKKRIS